MTPTRAFLLRPAASALRLAAFLAGTWLAALLPVELWIDQRRAANQAAGHVPDVGPESMMVIAVSMAAVLLLGVLVIEAVRSWAIGGRPLSPPACVALAAVACWPAGASLTIASLNFGYPGVFIASGVGVIGFYGVRHVGFAKRKSQAA